MVSQDPSDKYLNDQFELINQTPERYYFLDKKKSILVASWKKGSPEYFDPITYQQNFGLFANLVGTVKPRSIMIDCRYMGFSISHEDHQNYMRETQKLWVNSGIKKMAFLFKDNLSVQISMEDLRDVAYQNGVTGFNYRFFENVEEAIAWLNN